MHGIRVPIGTRVPWLTCTYVRALFQQHYSTYVRTRVRTYVRSYSNVMSQLHNFTYSTRVPGSTYVPTNWYTCTYDNVMSQLSGIRVRTTVVPM
jgi:hypothetical protein